LKREFEADAPNQKWATDITEIQLCGQKLYFSPILDLYNREIISYRISHRPKLDLVTSTLADAFSKIPDDTHLILHSDQGWHYRIPMYIAMLQEKGIRQSMSRKGNCLDNAVMESFFGCMKSELLYLRSFSSVDEFIGELHAYIEYYNHRRIKARLHHLSPVQYRLNFSAA
jgi:transposase InsO family protein